MGKTYSTMKLGKELRKQFRKYFSTIPDTLYIVNLLNKTYTSFPIRFTWKTGLKDPIPEKDFINAVANWENSLRLNIPSVDIKFKDIYNKKVFNVFFNKEDAIEFLNTFKSDAPTDKFKMNEIESLCNEFGYITVMHIVSALYRKQLLKHVPDVYSNKNEALYDALYPIHRSAIADILLSDKEVINLLEFWDKEVAKHG